MRLSEPACRVGGRAKKKDMQGGGGIEEYREIERGRKRKRAREQEPERKRAKEEEESKSEEGERRYGVGRP